MKGIQVWKRPWFDVVAAYALGACFTVLMWLSYTGLDWFGSPESRILAAAVTAVVVLGTSLAVTRAVDRRVAEGREDRA